MPHRSLQWAAVCLGMLASTAVGEETPLQALQDTLRPVPSASLSTPRNESSHQDELQLDPFLGSPFRDHTVASPGNQQAPRTDTMPVTRKPKSPALSELLDGITLGDRTDTSVSPPCDEHCAERCYESPADCVRVAGWLSAGYHSASNDLFNRRPHEFALHQGWLRVEKKAQSHAELGFQVDVMYGIDADDTQAFGNPVGSWDFANGFDRGSYGWSIPQAFVETVVGDWQLKAGHFYTLAGYEVVTAPDNFFYSHAMTMYNSEPFTHTGILATRQLGAVEFFAGWTLGWDTGFDQLNNGNSWLGGARFTLCEDATLTSISTAGDLGWRGDDGYSQSFVLETNLTDQLLWVLHSDLLRVDSTGEDNLGVNQYLVYSLCDCLSVGARVEWWKGDVLTGYAPHRGTLPVQGSLSYYAATFGVNLRPRPNVVLRPEVRTDWSPAADYEATYFGVDAIFTF